MRGEWACPTERSPHDVRRSSGCVVPGHQVAGRCDRAMRGRPVPIGPEIRQWIGGGVIVSLVPVPDLWVEHDPGRVGAWFDLFDPAVPRFVQIFWADEAGRMPWEPTCNPAVAAMQPKLFEDPTSVPPVW